MSDSKRVTLADVAAASGVSRATASFVLRDSPGQSISEATRQRVRQVACELGYVPHGIARALREGASRIVVITLDAAFDGHYARSYVSGLDRELAAHDHVLFVRYEPAGLLSSEAATAATRQVIDAIVPRAVLRFGEPFLTGHELDDSGGGWRDGLAAHVAVQLGYLADRGHRHIGIALPDRDTPLREIRHRFADKAAGALGLPPLSSVTLPDSRSTGPADGTAADRALREFRASHREVTAIAAFDDDVALRVLAAMRSLGLSAPGELAVIGFDDNGYGALTEPTLTTVRIDAQAHGRQAARTILGLDPVALPPASSQVIVRASA